MSENSPKEHCDNQVLRARLDAVAQAQKRSRAAFLASTVACVALLVAAWNAHSSSYRSFLSRTSFADNEVTREAQKAMVGEWVRSLKITIPILGIQAGAGDGAILGSTGLLVICIWIFVGVRRENHMVGLLLRDTKGCEVATRKMIFDAIVSLSLFPTVSVHDDALIDLDQEPQPRRLSMILASHKILIILPAVTILLLFLFDFLSIWILWSPFREGSAHLSEPMTRTDWAKRATIEFFCLLMFFQTSYLCFATVKYIDGTRRMLLQFTTLKTSEST